MIITTPITFKTFINIYILTFYMIFIGKPLDDSDLVNIRISVNTAQENIKAFNRASGR